MKIEITYIAGWPKAGITLHVRGLGDFRMQVADTLTLEVPPLLTGVRFEQNWQYFLATRQGGPRAEKEIAEAFYRQGMLDARQIAEAAVSRAVQEI